MRDIKFRGKRVDNNEWIYGNYVYEQFSKRHYITQQLQNGHMLIEAISETVGQYTGLHDKNGKEIYEGDIVKVYISGRWFIGKIIYEYSGFTIDVTNNKELEFGRRGIIEKFTEVIGNVWDNKDLLDKQ